MASEPPPLRDPHPLTPSGPTEGNHPQAHTPGAHARQRPRPALGPPQQRPRAMFRVVTAAVNFSSLQCSWRGGVRPLPAARCTAGPSPPTHTGTSEVQTASASSGESGLTRSRPMFPCPDAPCFSFTICVLSDLRPGCSVWEAHPFPARVCPHLSPVLLCATACFPWPLRREFRLADPPRCPKPVRRSSLQIPARQRAESWVPDVRGRVNCSS